MAGTGISAHRLRKREQLSGRERIRLALAHRETDRIPIAQICAGINPPAYRDLGAYLQRERGISAAAYLDPLIDVREVAPVYIGPGLAPLQDIWGVRRRAVSYGDGSYDEIEYYPLSGIETEGHLENHRWPSPDWFDYSVLPAVIADRQRKKEHAIIVANGNIFETSWYMRGFERMLMDFAIRPDMARAILERVTAFYVEFFSRTLAAAKGNVDLAFTADDIGGQTGLLMSLPMWEEFLKPCHVRLNAAIHEYGAEVVYHTDGGVMEAVDGLIDMGIDVLQALQFSAAGMEPGPLKEQFGDRLCFAGGVSVQTTLPHGTEEAVKEEVRELIDVLGRNGGYVLGPSHAVQAGTPPQNIVALFDTAAGYYPF